ncbi:MAG: hypothetical protein RI575_15190 [Balneolaceae bacterium]|nr:hypothetical protein [Balneolaceae bacterium]
MTDRSISSRFSWLRILTPMVFIAGVWSFAGSDKGKQVQADDLRVEVVQHVEVNRHTLHRPLTSQGTQPVELNEFGVAIVKVTGRAGQRVRVMLETEQSMKSDELNRRGSDLNFDLQAAWLEGEEAFSGNGWSRAEKVSNMKEFTVQLSSYGRTESSVNTQHNAEWGSQKSVQGRALKEVSDTHYSAPAGVRNISDTRGSATIYIKPVIKPDGKQHPGRFLADITVHAEYDDAFLFDRGEND